mgnify:CR=1 FL=1
MRWVSYTRSISSRIGEENPANTIAEQNANIEQYLKNKGYRISEKYSDRKRSAEAADGFDRIVQDGMTQKFDAVAVDSIFRFGKTLPFAIEVLQKTFYPVGIQFAVVEDDFCSTDRTADEVEQYFKEKVIEKIRFEFMASRQDSFEKGVLTHRQAKYGYDISEDRRSFVLDSESAYIVKLIFQMYLEGMTLQEIGAALDAQNVPSPQIQMTRNKKVTRKTKWPVTTIRSILVNPLYIGKLTLKLSGAEKKMEVPPIVSEEDFQKVQERINDSVKLPAPKRRSTPNILIKKIYDRASGERLLCRTTEDETRQIYSFDRKCNFNIQSLTNFLLTVFALLLGYYILVWKRKAKTDFSKKNVEGEYSLERSESTMLFMVFIASVCRLLLFKMNIMDRFTYYFIPFLYILYPYTINRMTLKTNRKIMKIIVYCIFAIYFIWMTTTYASQFYGTVPFEFFWE